MSDYALAWTEFLTGRFFFTIAGLIGVLSFIAILYGWNRLRGLRFQRDIWPNVRHDPLAVAIIYSASLFGLCLFLGMLALAGASVSTPF